MCWADIAWCLSESWRPFRWHTCHFHSPDAADSTSFDVQLGDIILTATDGLFDNMPDYMILQELKKLKVSVRVQSESRSFCPCHPSLFPPVFLSTQLCVIRERPTTKRCPLETHQLTPRVSRDVGPKVPSLEPAPRLNVEAATLAEVSRVTARNMSLTGAMRGSHRGDRERCSAAGTALGQLLTGCILSALAGCRLHTWKFSVLFRAVQWVGWGMNLIWRFSEDLQNSNSKVIRAVRSVGCVCVRGTFWTFW